MTDEPNWDDLIQLLRSRARILAHTYSGLQPADVEDLVQNVLLKLQTPITKRRLSAARSAEGYIFVMLRNAANDLVRRRQLERMIFRPLGEEGKGELPEPNYVEHPEAAMFMSQVLESLPDEDRELVYMRFWRNMTIAEIAHEKGMNYSATAVRLFRILHRLRDQLSR